MGGVPRRLPPVLESVAQVAVLDQFHDEEGTALVFAGGEDLDNVRVLRLSQGVRLAPKTGAVRRVEIPAAADHLDGHQTRLAEAKVAGLVDVTHTAATQVIFDAPLTEHR